MPSLAANKLDAPQLVADINPGSGSAIVGGLTAINGKLYFAANNGVGSHELWQYDGQNPPQLVADINPGNNNDTSIPQAPTAYQGKLYFSAGNISNGTELWEYDGINAPQVIDINPDRSSS